MQAFQIAERECSCEPARSHTHSSPGGVWIEAVDVKGCGGIDEVTVWRGVETAIA